MLKPWLLALLSLSLGLKLFQTNFSLLALSELFLKALIDLGPANAHTAAIQKLP